MFHRVRIFGKLYNLHTSLKGDLKIVTECHDHTIQMIKWHTVNEILAARYHGNKAKDNTRHKTSTNVHATIYFNRGVQH